MNEQVDWYPDHIKHGRYGNWLENNVDWALSRERYWGTPLPIWRCAQGHLHGGRARSRSSASCAGRDVSDVDPHRPAIDEVTFACPECGDESRRVPEVIDTWYDSGAMPFAQWGYHPDLGRGIEEFERHFPADFISEAIDQTRGWFYTLMAEGVLHFDSTAYRNVVCLGHIVGGRRPEDVEVPRQHVRSVGGAGPPGRRRAALVHDHERLAVGVTPDRPRGARRGRPPVPADALERLRRSSSRTRTPRASTPVIEAPRAGRPAAAGPLGPVAARAHASRRPATDSRRTTRPARAGAIQSFVDDLSNWYVRRSRRRFWNPARRARRRHPRRVPHAATSASSPSRRCSRRSRRSSPRHCGATSPRARAARPIPSTSPTIPRPTPALRRCGARRRRWPRPARSSGSGERSASRPRRGSASRCRRLSCTTRATTRRSPRSSTSSPTS